MNTISVLFWLFFGVVFYSFLGYGMVLWVLVRIKETLTKKPLTNPIMTLPEVTLFVAAYNEESIVDQKMLNTMGLLYPASLLKVLWVTDGSNDDTNHKLKQYPEVLVLFQPQRQGKTSAINRGMPFVTSPVVVFTDANTMLNPESVMEIVRRFSEPRVGCVAGEKRIAISHRENAAARGEGAYWKYESFLKHLDDRLYSTVGAAGELFAIRRELFEPMPADTLLDDFVLSLRIAMKGYKIAYCRDAYAVESASLDLIEEKKRKVRIAAGGIQSVLRLLPLLNVFRYGLLSFQYVSHRVLRWTVTPLALFLLFPLNILLVADGANLIYAVLLALQICFYGLAYWGYIRDQQHLNNRILSLPYYVLFMNWNVISGWRYLASRQRTGIWEKARRS